MKTKVILDRIKPFYRQVISGGFFVHANESAEIYKEISEELKELQLPEDANEAAKLMDEKYGHLVKFVEMIHNKKMRNEIESMKKWINFFGVVYIIGLALSVIAFIAFMDNK